MYNKTRRVKRLLFSPIALLQILQFLTSNRIIECHGIPDDARWQSAMYDRETDSFIILVESETFDPVPVGEMPPDLELPLRISGREESPVFAHPQGSTSESSAHA